jgi:DNA-binding transcriptional ArsR family regulator
MRSATPSWTRQALLPWVRLPSAWIETKGLNQFVWKGGDGAGQLAALMVLMVIAHHVDAKSAIASLTWDDLVAATGISRSKLANGLAILAERGLIVREPEGRSTFRLCHLGDGTSWAKLPAKPLYGETGLRAFQDFTLRHRTELDAVKLYLLFASRRDDARNVALLGYPAIEDYAGIGRNHIKKALSILLIHGLVVVDPVQSGISTYGVAHGYRLSHLNSRQHPGTAGRGFDVGAPTAALQQG